MAQRVLGSLFGPTPEELRRELAQQQAILSQNANRVSPSYGLGYNVGTLIGQGVSSLFGLQDPSLKQATDVQAILAEASKSGGSQSQMMQNAAQMFQDKGYGDLATKAAMQAQEFEITEQKAKQDTRLAEATIAEKVANAEAKLREKKDPFARKLEAAGILPDTPEFKKLMGQSVLKDVYIADKNMTPTNQAEEAVLKKYENMYPDNPGLAAERFLEYKSSLRQKENKAGVAQGQTGTVDISRLDTSFDKFVAPLKSKLDSINEALSLANSARTNPQAAVQLNTMLASLYQGGRLSNQDILRTENPGSLPQKVVNNFVKIISGVDTETNIEDKYKLLKAMQDGTGKALNNSLDAFKDRWSTAPNVSEDTINSYVKGSRWRNQPPESKTTKEGGPKTAEDFFKIKPKTKDNLEG